MTAWWDEMAGRVARGVQHDEAKLGAYSEEEARSAIVHAREDVAALVVLLSTAIRFLSIIRRWPESWLRRLLATRFVGEPKQPRVLLGFTRQSGLGGLGRNRPRQGAQPGQLTAMKCTLFGREHNAGSEVLAHAAHPTIDDGVRRALSENIAATQRRRCDPCTTRGSKTLATATFCTSNAPPAAMTS